MKKNESYLVCFIIVFFLLVSVGVDRVIGQQIFAHWDTLDIGPSKMVGLTYGERWQYFRLLRKIYKLVGQRILFHL